MREVFQFTVRAVEFSDGCFEVFIKSLERFFSFFSVADLQVEAVIFLSESANWPISSFDLTAMGVSSLPLPISMAAFLSFIIGAETERAMSRPITTAIITTAVLVVVTDVVMPSSFADIFCFSGVMWAASICLVIVLRI
jgi:hypothetical protein